MDRHARSGRTTKMLKKALATAGKVPYHFIVIHNLNAEHYMVSILYKLATEAGFDIERIRAHQYTINKSHFIFVGRDNINRLEGCAGIVSVDHYAERVKYLDRYERHILRMCEYRLASE